MGKRDVPAPDDRQGDPRDPQVAALMEDLAALGFEVRVEPNRIRIRNRGHGFVATVHLSHPDDLGERRRLFRELRRTLGGFTDRHLPWLFSASPAVTEPYRLLRALIERCQELRARRPTHSAGASVSPFRTGP